MVNKDCWGLKAIVFELFKFVCCISCHCLAVYKEDWSMKTAVRSLNEI